MNVKERLGTNIEGRISKHFICKFHNLLINTRKKAVRKINKGRGKQKPESRHGVIFFLLFSFFSYQEEGKGLMRKKLFHFGESRKNSIQGSIDPSMRDFYFERKKEDKKKE